MNLSSIFSKATDCVFKIFSEFIVTGTVFLPPQGYDPLTGAATGSETLYPVAEIIFIDYEESDIDGQIIRALDKKAIFRVSEVSVTITTQMKLRTASGDDWDIINVDKDPANQNYELQTRRP